MTWVEIHDRRNLNNFLTIIIKAKIDCQTRIAWNRSWADIEDGSDAVKCHKWLGVDVFVQFSSWIIIILIVPMAV